MAKLPKSYESFKKEFRQVWERYDRLAEISHRAGPLNEKTRELVKLALSIGAKLEGAVHSHARRAVKAGATAKEIRHVVLLSLTTLGFPSTVAALTWVEDVIKKPKGGKRRARRR